MSATLFDLADRVEALAASAREVDYLVMTATVPVGASYLWDPEDTNHRYTASLDAAMTLVPEGWRWCSYAWPRKDEPCRMELVGYCPTNGANLARGLAATPALALTAAVLRAKGMQAHG